MTSEKVIILESCPLIRRSLRRQATALNYEVLGVFESGEAALDFWMHKINSPVLLVSGYVLQGELNGLQTAIRFLSMDFNRVLFITGWDYGFLTSSALSNRRCRFLAKPFTNYQLKKEMVGFRNDPTAAVV